MAAGASCHRISNFSRRPTINARSKEPNAKAGSNVSRGAFTQSLRDEGAAHLGLPCRLDLGTQTGFPEAPVRINIDLADAGS
jgi:hypothetical protein